MNVNNHKLKILNVVGARPNFMKIAPLFREYERHKKSISPLLVHTRQHHDKMMSQTFFDSLKIPKPDWELELKGISTGGILAEMITQLDVIMRNEKPDIVLVVGDVNSTLAGALAANKNGIPVAHVESGLRSGDRTMPEEVNRILVDHMSEWLFVTEQSGLENLAKEGLANNDVHFVGNVMIDNLMAMMPQINKSEILRKLKLERNKYVLITMHRPANVDSSTGLKLIWETIDYVTSKGLKVVFPIHPRTTKNLQADKKLNDLFTNNLKLIITGPVDYPDFLNLIKNSSFILTDSGGIQEEAAYLKVPTITLRDSTERPSTVECGANRLCKLSHQKELKNMLDSIVQFSRSQIRDIPYNDGMASRRIVDILFRNKF